MRAYGNTKRINYNFTDCHPKKGWVNWWENIKAICKKRERQISKAEINKEINSLD